MKKGLVLFFVLFAIISISCTNEGSVEVGMPQEETLEHVLTDVEKSWVEELSPKRIGRLDPIVIRLTRDFDAQKIAEAITISDGVKGSFEAIDTRTIKFVPSEAFKSNSKITVDISLQTLFTDTSDENISINFYADFPSYSVSLDGLTLDTEGNYVFSGTLYTDIPLKQKDVSKVVSASLEQGNKSSNKKVIWAEDDLSDARSFTIPIDTGATEDRTLTVTWQGTSLGISSEADAGFTGSRSFLVPKEGAFEVVSIDNSNDDYISIDFSEALEKTQDLRGFLIIQTVSGSIPSEDIRFQVTGNNVKVFNDNEWDDAIAFTISEGIQSISGKVLEGRSSIALSDDWEKPAVRFSSNDGVILPTTQGSTLAIETRNVTGVIVEAFHISGDSIGQFLQVNELNGEYELDRVGEAVWIKTFDLTWDPSMQNSYVSHGLDLTELIKMYPDGMFQIRVAFRHEHIMYNCSASHDDFSDLEMPSDDELISYSSHTPYWNSENSYRNTYSYRNDPCHPNFYRHQYYNSIVARRNVLVSDVGVMAKKTSDDTWYITAANLQTTEPISGAAVTMYSYIGKVVAEGKTNSEGGVILSSEAPSYIEVKSNNQSSYLNLSTSTSLNISHFDVGGEKPINGVKGFIYGERGVWRPGDSIYLTFILDDQHKQFPPNFPVTFELSDPAGKVTESKVIHGPVDGFYAIETSTLENAITGNWTARIKAGGHQWLKNIKVETVVPNRLSVDLDIGGPYFKRTGNEVTLTGAWLHGAPIPNYEAEISAFFYTAPTEFVGYNDYIFTDSTRTVSTRKHDLWVGELNTNSQAFIDLNFDSRAQYPGKMKVQMVTTIHEPTGLFSKEQALFDYEPYETYVGLKLPVGGYRGTLSTDVDHQGEVVVLNPDGGSSSDVTLEYTLHKLEWKWWWEKDALSAATYTSSRYSREIDAGTFRTSGGKGNFTFNLDSDDWGRYLISVKDIEGGHRASQIVYINRPGWVGRSPNEDSESASILTLSKDKDVYLSGDTAVISFPSNDSGSALITVEKDGAIVKQEWIKTQEDTTAYNLELTDDFTPNVYVHVTLVQPHLQTENSLPIRMYGVVPVLIEDPKTRLQPVIARVDSYEPNKEATVTVSEENGRPMTFTLAVVEEGLLGLTRFRTENPWDEFYKKEASQLFSWDIYSSVINAYSGKLETLLSIGGGEAEIESPEASNMRFKPVVKYFGPFELPANSKKDITFEMPEYVGSVRAMVVAGKDGSYGIAESTVPVKSDLMVLSSLPRTLGAEESLEVPVTVFNGTNEDQTVEVEFLSRGVVTMSEKKTISISAEGEENAIFTVDSSELGWSEVTVSASMGNIRTSSTTNIETISRGIPVYATEKIILNRNKSEEISLDLIAEVSSLEFMVELSSLPPIDISDRLSYLVRYPHGCIEQITSAGFPQLYIPDFVNSTSDEIEDIKKNVQAVIDKYPAYQTSSGGFGYWPGRQTPHGWGTSYAGHFMIEAKKAGYTVPNALFDSWLSWQKQQAAQWTSADTQSSQTQAYRLYTLALAGEGDIGAMNRLNAIKLSSNTEVLMLSAAYAILGHKSTALSVLDKMVENTSPYRYTGGTFASSTRDLAMRLYVHNLLGESDKLAQDVNELSDVMSSGKYLNTQEISWSFISLLPYYKGTKYQKISYEISQDGKVLEDDFTGGSKTISLVPSDTGVHTVKVKNTGTVPMYGKVLVKGTSVPGSELEKNDELSLYVTYYNESGNRTSPDLLDIGDNFRISISIQNMDRFYNVENVALTLPIPTGWEILNERIASTDDSVSDVFDYQDIRDEAIYTYFSLNSRERKIFNFNGTVTHTGEYNIPAIHAEAMYDDTYSAVYPGVNAADR